MLLYILVGTSTKIDNKKIPYTGSFSFTQIFSGFKKNFVTSNTYFYNDIYNTGGPVLKRHFSMYVSHSHLVLG